MSRALIVGAGGMIGRELAAALKRAGRPALETTRATLDLSDPASWRLPEDVSLAYLCAGVTSVEACERDRAGTARINVENTTLLARLLLERGAFVVFPSTNVVFDGSLPWPKAEDEPSPVVEYGRQKLAVERALAATGRPHAVLRLSKVLGPRPRLFAEWIESLRAGRRIEPFRDKVLAPVPLPFAAAVLLRIGECRGRGVAQLSAPQDVTYEEVARFIARRLGAPADLVVSREARSALAHPGLAPAHTTLAMDGLRALGLEPPGVWDTVRWCLDSFEP